MEELIMSDVVAVTNRHLCVRDYFEQIEVVASSGVNKIIVREKRPCTAGIQRAVCPCQGYMQCAQS